MNPSSPNSEKNGSPAPSDVEFGEGDPLWNLMGDAQSKPASDLFSRNVLREVRLQDAESNATSLWQQLLRPRVWLGSAVALALVAFLLLPILKNSGDSTEIAKTGSTFAEQDDSDSLTAYLDEELLLVAADEPGLFSDEDVVAMLF